MICGNIIESKSVHDLVCCKCESCYIDDGRDYTHIGVKDFTKMIEILDNGKEVKINNESNNIRQAK